MKGSSSGRPAIATITPIRGDAQPLRRALGSILGQRGVTIDRIVVAIGPDSDEAYEVVRSFEDPRIVAIGNPSGATGAGLNLAIGAAGAVDVIARVDARAVLPPHYLVNALETLELTGAGNVGAVQRPVGSTLVQRSIARAMRSPVGSGGVAYRHATEVAPVDTAWLGVFRRSALEAVGGFDEAFLRNQDAELNARLNAAGHRVWVDPRLVVEYEPRASLRGLARQYYDYGTWRFRTMRRHPTSIRARQFAAPAVVLGVAVTPVLVHRLGPLALAGPAAYVLGVASIGVGRHAPPPERVVASTALVVMHLSWGAGFLRSLGRSIVLARWSNQP